MTGTAPQNGREKNVQCPYGASNVGGIVRHLQQKRNAVCTSYTISYGVGVKTTRVDDASFDEVGRSAVLLVAVVEGEGGTAANTPITNVDQQPMRVRGRGCGTNVCWCQ